MEENQHPTYNRLGMQRRKLGLAQRDVARLLGNKSHGPLSTYEHGRVLPTLKTALRLEIILGVRVSLLFPGMYQYLEEKVEQAKRQLPSYGQLALFDQQPRKDAYVPNS